MSVPTVSQRNKFRKTPSPKHLAFLRTVPLMGETVATIEIVAVEERECPAPTRADKKLACPVLRSSDFSFSTRKPTRAAPAGKQKIRVFASQAPRSSAIAAVLAVRHMHALSSDEALVYVKEFGIKDELATDAKAKNALASAALNKLYANWKSVERVIIVIDSRLLPEVVTGIFMRMFPTKQLPQKILSALSERSIRILIDVKTARVKISRH